MKFIQLGKKWRPTKRGTKDGAFLKNFGGVPIERCGIYWQLVYLGEGQPSLTWMSICTAKGLLQNELCWRVGRGDNISIWNDSWILGIEKPFKRVLLKESCRFRLQRLTMRIFRCGKGNNRVNTQYVVPINYYNKLLWILRII